jgi:chemotaxis protein MotB
VLSLGDGATLGWRMIKDPNHNNTEAQITAAPQSNTFMSERRGTHAFYRHSNGLDNEDLSNIIMPSHWAVPWSDLMMVMMVMFAVMLAVNLAEQDMSNMFAAEASESSAKKNNQQDPMQNKTAATENPLKDTHDQPDRPADPSEKDALTPLSSSAPHNNKLLDDASIDPNRIPIEDIIRLSKSLITEANLGDIEVVLTQNQAIKVSVRGNLLFDSGKAEVKPEARLFLNKLALELATNNFQVEVAGHTDNFPVSSPSFPTNWELSSARAARVARYLIQQGKLEPGRFTILGHAYFRPIASNNSPENKAKNRRVEILITRTEYQP